MNELTTSEIHDEIQKVQSEDATLILTQKEIDRVVELVHSADVPSLPLVGKIMRDVIDGNVE